MKKINSKGVLLVMLILLLGATPALATHPNSKSEIENLKQRINALEAGALNEPSEKPAFPLSAAGKHLTFSGLLELEGNYTNLDKEGARSDLTLSSFEFSTEVSINDQISGHTILLYNENPNDESLKVDEAVISLRCPKPFGSQTAAFHGGKMYLPFGKFNSNMVTDPLTLDLGEVNDTAALFALEGELWNLSLGVFNGKTDVSGDQDRLDSLVAAFEIMPRENLTFGLSYISDLAESNNGLVVITSLYSNSVAGASAFISAIFGQVGFEAEILGALDDFDAALIGTSDLTGNKPLVWNLELNWRVADKSQLTARYEQAHDFKDDVARYGVAGSYGLFNNTIVALEYQYVAPNTAPDGHTLTAQLALEF